MKKRGVLLLFIMIVVLAGCGQDAPSDSADVSEDDGAEEANETSDVQEVTEQDTATDPDEEESIEEAEEVDGEQEEENISAESILRQSYEVMSELTSVHMSATMDMEELMDGTKVIEEKEIEMTMLLQDPYSRHFALKIESNMADPIVSEVYEMPETHYTHSSVHDVNWGTSPNPNGSQELSSNITEASLEDHLVYSHQFEVSESDDYYELTFSGSFDEFETAVYGGVKDMLTHVGKELPMDLEDVIHAYKITIEKDTFLVKYYNIHYEGQVPEDEGEYIIVMDGAVTVDEYSEHDEIVVPQEVLDEAVPF